MDGYAWGGYSSYDNYIQYIVVRKDLVPSMGVGKTAVQVAHASLGVLLDPPDLWGTIKLKTDFPSFINIQTWLHNKFTKLVVYTKSKESLLNLANKLDEDKIGHKLIYDNCLTVLEPEEPNGTTLTCMGLVPIDRNTTPKYLKKLRLL